MNKLRKNLAAKLVAGFLCVITSSITILSLISIFTMASFGMFDSPKKIVIANMQDYLFSDLCHGYSTDLWTDVFYNPTGEDMFSETNFTYELYDDEGNLLKSTYDGSASIYTYDTYMSWYGTHTELYRVYFPDVLMLDTSNEDTAADTELLENGETDEAAEESSIYAIEEQSLESIFQDYSDTEYVDGYSIDELDGQSIEQIKLQLNCYIDENLTYKDQFYYANQIINFLYNTRYAQIVIMILNFFFSGALFVFLMFSAGYRKEQAVAETNWFDNIPLDLIAVVSFTIFAVELVTLDEFYTYSVAMMMAIFLFWLLDYSILLCIMMSVSTRIKCKVFWKNTFIYAILHFTWKCLKFIGHIILELLKGIPLIWRIVLILFFLTFGEFFLFMVVWSVGDLLILWFLEKLVVVPCVLIYCLQLRKLQVAASKMAEGDLAYHINTKYLLGTLKNHGEALNGISEGMARAVEERMKSERFKTELITNVSHDIKTPLTSIINYVDLLEKEHLQNETAVGYISIIAKHSERLKKLVVDLVDASKASSGVLPVNMVSMDVSVMLEQLSGEYTERLRRSNLELILKKDSENVKIMADGQHLSRVFDNLLGNICKYSLGGTRVYLTLTIEANNVMITFKNVSKTELNITSDELMERFVRGDSSRNTEGSGLGLSIAKSLVELQGGAFSLDIDGDLFKSIIKFPIIKKV